MGRLEDKVAVITGAASGIGEAAARLFVEEGARVVVADIQTGEGEALAAELGSAAAFVRTDVTREDDVAGAVEFARSEFGRLDVMYNNAGGFGARGSVTEITSDGFDATVALLLRSVFYGLKHAGRVFAEQGHGVVLSTASIAGLQPGAGPHLYAMCKSAVVFLTKSAALELGERGVRVNCICPGGVVTPLVLEAAGLDEDALPLIEAGMATRQPIERAGMPIDIARAALWLASDDADYVTGHALTVDGGEATGIKFSKQPMT